MKQSLLYKDKHWLDRYTNIVRITCSNDLLENYKFLRITTNNNYSNDYLSEISGFIAGSNFPGVRYYLYHKEDTRKIQLTNFRKKFPDRTFKWLEARKVDDFIKFRTLSNGVDSSGGIRDFATILPEATKRLRATRTDEKEYLYGIIKNYPLDYLNGGESYAVLTTEISRLKFTEQVEKGDQRRHYKADFNNPLRLIETVDKENVYIPDTDLSVHSTLDYYLEDSFGLSENTLISRIDILNYFLNRFNDYWKQLMKIEFCSFKTLVSYELEELEKKKSNHYKKSLDQFILEALAEKKTILVDSNVIIENEDNFLKRKAEISSQKKFDKVLKTLKSLYSEIDIIQKGETYDYHLQMVNEKKYIREFQKDPYDADLLIQHFSNSLEKTVSNEMIKKCLGESILKREIWENNISFIELENFANWRFGLYRLTDSGEAKMLVLTITEKGQLGSIEETEFYEADLLIREKHNNQIIGFVETDKGIKVYFVKTQIKPMINLEEVSEIRKKKVKGKKKSFTLDQLNNLFKQPPYENIGNIIFGKKKRWKEAEIYDRILYNEQKLEKLIPNLSEDYDSKEKRKLINKIRRDIKKILQDGLSDNEIIVFKDSFRTKGLMQQLQTDTLYETRIWQILGHYFVSAAPPEISKNTNVAKGACLYQLVPEKPGVLTEEILTKILISCDVPIIRAVADVTTPALFKVISEIEKARTSENIRDKEWLNIKTINLINQDYDL